MTNSNKNIITVGGGTGGHLFPAIATSEELKSRGYKVKIITDQRCRDFIPKDFGIEYEILYSYNLKGSVFSKIKGFFQILFSIFCAFKILIKNRPNLVIGFGGYTTFPILLSAKILLIPIMIHEQNCFLGKANAFFANSAKKIALSYPKTLNVPDHLKYKISLTGNPVRAIIKDVPILRVKKPNSEYFHILVFGGSQGASFFSNFITNVIKLIMNENPSIKLHITQQVRKKELFRLKRAYKKLGVKFELSDFFNDMPEKLARSDIVVSRSGASTISELIAAEQPAVLIPFPGAMNNHQYYNAMFLHKKQASWCYEQHKVTPKMISEKILQLYNNPKILNTARDNLKSMQRDAKSILVNTVEKILH